MTKITVTTLIDGFGVLGAHGGFLFFFGRGDGGAEVSENALEGRLQNLGNFLVGFWPASNGIRNISSDNTIDFDEVADEVEFVGEFGVEHFEDFEMLKGHAKDGIRRFQHIFINHTAREVFQARPSAFQEVFRL